MRLELIAVLLAGAVLIALMAFGAVLLAISSAKMDEADDLDALPPPPKSRLWGRL